MVSTVKVFTGSDWVGVCRHGDEHLAMLCVRPVRTWSFIQSAAATSSAEAELCSAVEGGPSVLLFSVGASRNGDTSCSGRVNRCFVGEGGRRSPLRAPLKKLLIGRNEECGPLTGCPEMPGTCLMTHFEGTVEIACQWTFRALPHAFRKAHCATVGCRRK